MTPVQKWAGIFLALILALASVPFVTDSSDANAGDAEGDPLVWWNNTIILLPEVVAGEITDESQVLEPPESLLIDWGDGQSEVRNVDGYVTKGSVEIVHTYETTGTYHITCTPQKGGYIFETYELWMMIMGAPVVYFYDGDTLITTVTAANGYGIGAYEDNYFSRISAPENPTKEGLTFEYWTLDGEKFDFNTTITSPTILKAHWAEIPTVTVNVDGKNTVFEAGKTVADVTVPAREGYDFAGWYSDAECTVSVNNDTVLTDGMTLYSKFVEKEPAGITVNVDGKDITVDPGFKVSGIAVPEKQGYVFTGWYSNEACTVSVNNDTVLTDGMKLYSGWKEAIPDKQADKENSVPAMAVIVCVLGAIVSFVGLRYHPAIMVVGMAVAVVGVADIFGFIEVF